MKPTLEDLIEFLIETINDYEGALCGDRLTTRDNIEDAWRETQDAKCI